MITPAFHGIATTSLPARNFTLSPSDLTFLWEDCPRCFYNKAVHKFGPPRGIMPSVFNRIDGAMKTFYNGCRTETISPDLPPGVILESDSWLESRPLTVPDSASAITLRGKMDTAIRFDDGTFGIVDFKTALPKPEHVTFYGRQLHAYALAAENPALGRQTFGPVRRLGLIVFAPRRYKQRDESAWLGGEMHWLEIPRDDEAYLSFLGQVVAVLEQPAAPCGSPTCLNCAYRDTARRTGL